MLLGTLVGFGTAHAESPLDRLRSRSAAERWKDVRPAFEFSDDSGWRTLDEPAGKSKRPTRRSIPAAERDPIVKTSWETEPPATRPATASTTRLRARKPRALEGTLSRPIPLPSPDEEPFQPFEEPEDAVAPVQATVVDDEPAESNPVMPVPMPDYEAAPAGFRLSRIQDIQPFADYEPNPELRDKDPCGNLCPRPEDCPEGFNTRCPEEFELPLAAGDIRPVTDIGFEWEASNLYSNPLYFDDPALERYGHTHHHLVQPFASAARFGVQLIAIPYKATIDPYCKKMYALGYYRPGDHAPQQYEPIPFNLDAAIVQGGVTTGAFFLFP